MFQSPLRGHTQAVSRQHIKHGKIGLQPTGEIRIAKIRPQNSADLRNQQCRSQPSCQQRCECKSSDPAAYRFYFLALSFRHGIVFRDQQHSEIQHQEDTDHNGNIVIGQDAKPQGHSVHDPSALSDQPLRSQKDQW